MARDQDQVTERHTFEVTQGEYGDGPVLDAINSALDAADERDEGSDPSDRAAATVLQATGFAIDIALAERNVYAVAALAGRALDLLRDLRMTPASRGARSVDDPFVDVWAKLSGPTQVRNPPQP